MTKPFAQWPATIMSCASYIDFIKQKNERKLMEQEDKFEKQRMNTVKDAVKIKLYQQ